jgi:hypothetical protein
MWFLRSGIQDGSGGVARYYRTDTQQNLPISTEITGYSASAFVYLHTLDRNPRFLEQASKAAQFLARTAWQADSNMMPFEICPPSASYFFDCGIIVRALLTVWRATGTDEFLDCAVAVGKSMKRDFAASAGFHPIVSIPDRTPAPRDPLRWSRVPGCYQLKAAMAWWDLSEATGESEFREPYEAMLADSLAHFEEFLPGHPDRVQVVDRLHAFLYFLEGMLPRACDRLCTAAIREGIARTAQYVRELAPQFERSDVYAQLLRVRLFADFLGAAPLDLRSAGDEAEQLAGFQARHADPRIDKGFYFGRKNGAMLPFINPVSTAFALQALDLWSKTQSGEAKPLRHLLI